MVCRFLFYVVAEHGIMIVNFFNSNPIPKSTAKGLVGSGKALGLRMTS